MASRAERRKIEQAKHKAQLRSSLGVVLMAILPFIMPLSAISTVIALGVIFLASIPVARDGYRYRAKWYEVVGFLAVHAIIIALFGWWIWPIVKVSPRKKIVFAGYANETFNFSVRNNTPDDIYDVQIPFPIGKNRHLDGKVSAKVMPNGDPPERVYDDYNYCYGKNTGDVHNIQPDEQEVLIVRIRHLASSGVGSFSVTYAGGDRIETKPGKPNYLDVPYSYSDMQGTVGVRGDYRICKYVINTDGLVQK